MNIRNYNLLLPKTGILIGLITLIAMSLSACVSTIDSLDKGPRALMAKGLISTDFSQGLDVTSKRKALDTEIKALSSGNTGAAIEWTGSDDWEGKVTPGQPFEISGKICRRYSHMISGGDIHRTAEVTACQNDNGLWEPLN